MISIINEFSTHLRNGNWKLFLCYYFLLLRNCFVYGIYLFFLTELNMIELTVKTLDSHNHGFSVPDDVSLFWIFLHYIAVTVGFPYSHNVTVVVI